MKDEVYNPSNNEILHIWDSTCTIRYENTCIKLNYETEPPHGDFLYSVRITIDEKEEDSLPFWIYGRNIYFYCNFVVMEGLDGNNGYRAPLHTIIINFEWKQYAVIDEWYNDFSADCGILILENKFNKKKIRVENPEQLIWYPIYL